MKNIIFDWSGVVKDALACQVWIVNRMLLSYNKKEISAEEFRDNWVQPYDLFYRKYLGDDFTSEKQSSMYKEAIFHEDCPQSIAVPGMPELIRRCKDGGMFLAIVSSDLPEKLHEEIAAWNLEGAFDAIITNVPDKMEAVQSIVKTHALDPQETCFIGDSNHEIDVAKATGIRSIAVTWGFTSERNLRSKHPDYLVRNVEELEKVCAL